MSLPETRLKLLFSKIMSAVSGERVHSISKWTWCAQGGILKISQSVSEHLLKPMAVVNTAKNKGSIINRM